MVQRPLMGSSWPYFCYRSNEFRPGNSLFDVMITSASLDILTEMLAKMGQTER